MRPPIPSDLCPRLFQDMTLEELKAAAKRLAECDVLREEKRRRREEAKKSHTEGWDL